MLTRIVETPESDDEEIAAGFPGAAWAGLFGKWRDTVAPCTEASLESLWAAFLLAAGLILGRSVWRSSPRPIYPNFYLLLLGQTGDSRKSTVLWFAEELLQRVGVDIQTIRGIVSTEGLLEALAQERIRALGYADEFRSLLSVAKRKGTQDIITEIAISPRMPSRGYGYPPREIDYSDQAISIVHYRDTDGLCR